MQNKPAGPVGVFDSGLGGLTVLKSLRGRLPREDFFYFADTRFLPYGDRSEGFLRERGVLIAQAMVERGVKALVIACNTATAAAAEAIRAAVKIPVVAIEPGVKPAVALSQTGEIAVLATTRTVESQRFQRLLDTHAQHVRVHVQACPGLAEAIEAEGAESDLVACLLDRFVLPLAATRADVVVLGCTHYPWLSAAIAQRLPTSVRLLDTGEAVARQLERRLHMADLQGGSGALHLASSGLPQPVHATVDRLWGQKIKVEHWLPGESISAVVG